MANDNLSNRLATGEGKHTPKSTKHKEVNDTVIDKQQATKKRDSVTTVSTTVLTLLSTVGGVSLIGVSIIPNESTSPSVKTTAEITIEEVTSNNLNAEVVLTDLEENSSAKFCVQNNFVTYVQQLKAGYNNVSVSDLTERTKYQVEVVVDNVIVASTTIKTLQEGKISYLRW